MAVWTSHNGTLAVPVSWAKGHDLVKHQAVTLTGNVFGFNSTKLTTQGRAEVKVLAAAVKRDKGIFCEGYADYAGSGGHEESLSAARAKTVCLDLKALGVLVTEKSVGYG